jgi:hypothetical protein
VVLGHGLDQNIVAMEGAVQQYSERTERRMRTMFQRLSEKDRRRYAAVEAEKLGHGGVHYIAALFGIDAKTIRQGLADLDAPTEPAPGRVRKKGADADGPST